MANENLMASIDKALQQYGVGGAFEKQRGAQLKTAERKYTTGAQASLTGRGLSGTTIAASIPGAFEQDVAAPYRTETERMRSGSEMQALLAKAGFLEREQDRQIRIDMSDKDREAQERAAALNAAASVHGGRGGGGGGSGGGSASSMISDWRSRTIDRGGRLGFSGGGGYTGAPTTGAPTTGAPTTGGARQHTGGGSGGFRGTGGGGDAEFTGVWQKGEQGMERIDKPEGQTGIPAGKSPSSQPGAAFEDDKWVYYKRGGSAASGYYSISKATGGRRE